MKKESSSEEKPKKAKKAAVEEGRTKTVLIITEKPAAAEKIADSLSDGKDKKFSEGGVPYYEFNKGGNRIVVACAVGHLFGVAEEKNGKRAEIPSFSVAWKPAFEGKNKSAGFTKKYYLALKKLAKEADEFIVATDYDVEGEVIGWNVVRFIAGKKDAKRMKFSSLTKDELNNAWEHLSPTINWGQAIAGETRHFVDWFYGINLSRALMRSLSKAGRFRIMSIGRVQGPALAIIVDKELEIKGFKPEPYWQVFLQVEDLNKQKIEVKYPKDLEKESDLLRFRQLKGKRAQAKTDVTDNNMQPPVPFDLTTLQTEAYKHFGLTPSQSLSVAQKLYLAGVISYPRTSSQKYPEGIGYDKILKSLGKHFSQTKYAVNKKPIEGAKSDPAHPAIYPTGEYKNLEGQEKQLYELVVKRFISCFCKDAIVEERKIEVSINDLKFYARGLQVKEKEWMNVYSSDIKEEKVPVMNGEVTIKELRIEQKMTQPPKRYSAASLVKELEKRNLGTKATRASIIETLYGRGYVKERSLEATPLGLKLIETLRKYSPIIVDEALTRELEEEVEDMQVNLKDLHAREEKVLEKAKKSIVQITKQMRDKEELVGKELSEGTEEMWAQEKEDAMLTKCTKCNKGDLRILFNRGSHRYFIGCSNYPECKTTFSLPPNSLIKAVKDAEGKPELCKECKFPMLLALRKAKRPWKFCFNPECVTNKEWMKKREEYAEKKKSESESSEVVEKKEVKKKGKKSV